MSLLLHDAIIIMMMKVNCHVHLQGVQFICE